MEAGNLTSSFIKMDNFSIIFDNLYHFLKIPRKQTPNLFSAMLIGIVDTWIEVTARQAATHKTIALDEQEINRKIIENTLLALTIDKQLTPLDMKSATKTPKFNFYKPVEVDLKDNLITLPEGFYTPNIEIFCALHIKNNTQGKTYSFFMPMNNLVYTTSSVDDIAKKLFYLRHSVFTNLPLNKIAGKL